MKRTSEPFHWEYDLNDLSEEQYKEFLGKAIGFYMFSKKEYDNLGVHPYMTPEWKKRLKQMPPNLKVLVVLAEKGTKKFVEALYYDPSDRGFFWDEDMHMFNIEDMMPKKLLELLFDSMNIGF